MSSNFTLLVFNKIYLHLLSHGNEIDIKYLWIYLTAVCTWNFSVNMPSYHYNMCKLNTSVIKACGQMFATAHRQWKTVVSETYDITTALKQHYNDLYSTQTETIKTYLKATIDKTFVIQLLENPPNAFHERWIHRLIVILEVNPTTQSCYVLLCFPMSNNTDKSQTFSNTNSDTPTTRQRSGIIYKRNVRN